MLRTGLRRGLTQVSLLVVSAIYLAQRFEAIPVVTAPRAGGWDPTGASPRPTPVRHYLPHRLSIPMIVYQ